MQTRRRTTIADVAARAGVSTSTVSRALNDRGYVASPVRARVIAAVQSLGYVPDVNARNLRVGSRMDVGVLISDLRNPFYAELAAGIEGRLREAGYHMLLVNDGGDPDEELAAVRTFAAMRVPGVIMTPVGDTAVATLIRHGIHVVQADRVVDPAGADSVTSANDAGARLAVRHLLGLAHERIAMLIDETAWTTGAGRLAGYRSAHADAGIPVDEELIVFTGLQSASAQPRVARLLDEQPDLTAILAANNLLAQAAFNELQDRGILIPQQVSLVAYDDLAWMTMVVPKLTAVSQHAQEIGRRSADLLISRFQDGPGWPAGVSLLVQPTLMIRDSTDRPADRRLQRAARTSVPHAASPPSV